MKKIAHLYNERFNRFGRDPRTVGWGSREDQILRFRMLFRDLNPRGKTILDVGCGLGDLVPFLEQQTAGNFNYIGIDVAENLVEDARKLHGNERCIFLCSDVFSDRLPSVDLAVLSGALSFRTEGILDYAKLTVERMFFLSKEAACLNFLSKNVDYELEKNQHFDPGEVISWALKASRLVRVYHDYPLYEFTIQILRKGD